MHESTKKNVLNGIPGEGYGLEAPVVVLCQQEDVLLEVHIQFDLIPENTSE